MRELLRRSRSHIEELEKRRRDLDAHIAEFKDVETQVSAELRQRGADPKTTREASMAVYKAPLKDIAFVLNEVLDVSSLSKLPGYQDATPDTIQAILEEAAKLCENVLFRSIAPATRRLHYENGVVRTPKGFKHAYDMFRERRLDRRHLRRRVWRPRPAGDGGLRPAGDVHGVEPGVRDVSRPQPRCLRGAGAPRLGRAQEAVPAQAHRRHVDGHMCLTEPHCGTDLACCAPRPSRRPTAAIRSPAPRFHLGGEHDLAETSCTGAGAAAGCAERHKASRCSWCRVPAKADGPNGQVSVGERNGIRCGAIEHKMGIKANATCVMNLDGATGWLVGELNRGSGDVRDDERRPPRRRHAGAGHRRTSYQSAVAYARDRMQGRSLTGRRTPTGRRSDHRASDVRRMLLIQKSFTEAARALSLWVGMLIDEAHSHPTPTSAPPPTTWCSADADHQGALHDGLGMRHLAVQTYGGHGFIRENGVEQLVRDARITHLRGTNGIQALDLVGRKLPMRAGRRRSACWAK